MNAPVGNDGQHWRETLNRLTLARMLLRHGHDHGETPGTLNQMIAIHNAHNAVEIVLRSIVFYLELPAQGSQQSFPQLLTLIQSSQYFTDNNLQLPLQAEIRTLNDVDFPVPGGIIDFFASNQSVFLPAR